MSSLRILSVALLLSPLPALFGCQLVVDFDREKIVADSGVEEDGGVDEDGGADEDGGEEVDSGGVDGGIVADGGDMDGGGVDGGGMDGGVMDGGGMDGGPTMTCGNGTREGTETCDDGNTNACGTCSGDCAMARTPTAATGSITAVAVASLSDGETFTLDDGAATPTIFEFDDDAAVAGTHVSVDISGATTADDVRDAIVTAVNGVGASLTIGASSGGAATVDLANTIVGVAGNQTITETVAAAGFMVTGMSGGLTRNCGTGVGCAGNNDCTSGSCTADVCD